MSSTPNRRDVLKAGGAAAAAGLAWSAALGAAAVAGAAAAAGDKPAKATAAAPPAIPSAAARRPFKKAVMYGMIGEGKTVLDKFRILKDCGFDGVEMDSPTGLNRDDIK